jgi:hypothetical protein
VLINPREHGLRLESRIITSEVRTNRMARQDNHGNADKGIAKRARNLLLCAGKNNDSQPIRRNKRKGIYRGSRDEKRRREGEEAGRKKRLTKFAW